jgi:hypothetical protein
MQILRGGGGLDSRPGRSYINVGRWQHVRLHSPEFNPVMGWQHNADGLLASSQQARPHSARKIG